MLYCVQVKTIRLTGLIPALFAAVAFAGQAGPPPATPPATTSPTPTVSVAAAVPTPSPASATSTATPPVPTPALQQPPLQELIVEGAEPRFVAKTTRDRIGRIWAPVLIDGKGPFRLVLDTGANHSAVIPATAAALGSTGSAMTTVVTGFTGSAVVPTIAVSKMEVGDLLMGPTTLPVVADVFGGAQGVLGNEGLEGKRILADFSHDRLVIAHSHGDSGGIGFTVVNFKVIEGGLPECDVKVGGIHAKAIIDTGAQGTVGNLLLQEALMRHPPRETKRADIIGVTLDVQSGDNVPAPQIEMGGLTISGVRIIFGDMYLFQHYHLTNKPVLLVGMDLLGSFDVLIIDYRMHQMMVKLSRPSLMP